MSNNIETIQTLYACFREGNHEGFRTLCAADIEWRQNPGFPGGGISYGADQILENVIGKNRNEWNDFGFHIERMLDAGDSVVVLGRYKGTHGTSGKALDAEAAHIYQVVEGKVTRFQQYADTKTMWDSRK